ncbi:MAG TPA: hypothetical protein VGI48_19720 [Caldimonas sp.]
MRKNSSCFSFMYSDSGIASNSSSVRSRPGFAFHAFASFGSALCACLGVSCSCLFISRVGGRGGANRSANRDVGGGNGACTGATKYFGVPRPGLRGTKPFGAVATGAPAVAAGATLLPGAAADDGAGAFAACDFPLGAGFGAGVGNLVAGDFVGAGFFFATGAGARPLLAGAAFLVGAALRTNALRGAAFLVATGFFAAGFFSAGFFFATVALPLPLAGAGRRGAGFAVGRVREVFATGFFAVFLTAGFFTGSPRNGIASLARETRCEGGAVFDRRGL